MTAYGSVEGAVEAMRRGARDYLEKPWDNNRLVAILRTQIELGRAVRKSLRLEGENQALRREGLPDLVVALARHADGGPAHGTGGPLRRQRPHPGRAWQRQGGGRTLAPRRLRPGRPADDHGECRRPVRGGVRKRAVRPPEGLVHRRQDRPHRSLRAGRHRHPVPRRDRQHHAGQQAKLLRVLQAGEFERVGSSRTRRVDVRVLSATNADLRAEVAAGRFREDLLYRLNTIEIRIPPLRDRRDDLPVLAAQFLARYATKYRKPITAFRPEAMQALLGLRLARQRPGTGSRHRTRRPAGRWRGSRPGRPGAGGPAAGRRRAGAAAAGRRREGPHPESALPDRRQRRRGRPGAGPVPQRDVPAARAARTEREG